jgi:gliding motility-associated-like protein
VGPGVVAGGSTSSPTVNAAGTYTVTITDPSNGCTSTATAAVTTNTTTPDVTASGGFTIDCNNPSGVLNASSTVPGATYSWSGTGIVSGINTATPTVNAGSTYTVTVTDPSNGCTNTATVIVLFNAVPPNVGGVGQYYLNCLNGEVTLNATSTTPGVSYSWTGPGIVSGGSTNNPVVDAAGNYTVTVTDPANGCSNFAPVLVSPGVGPIANAGTDVSILPGASTTLTATGGGSYLWSTGDTSSTITVSPNVTTDYCVVVINSTGCSDTSCVRITLETPCPGNNELLVPNAFSPNNDGHNDRLCLQGWSQCISNFKIIIYDRWGEKVFESSDASFCWDGVYKGKALDPAVFVYYITADLPNAEKVEKKGNISLIR